jgi:hypothetical protein
MRCEIEATNTSAVADADADASTTLWMAAADAQIQDVVAAGQGVLRTISVSAAAAAQPRSCTHAARLRAVSSATTFPQLRYSLTGRMPPDDAPQLTQLLAAYTTLHRDIMSGRRPPRFLVTDRSSVPTRTSTPAATAHFHQLQRLCLPATALLPPPAGGNC